MIFGTVLNATSVTEGDQPAYYAYYGESGRQRADAVTDVALNLIASNGGVRRPVEPDRASRHRRLRSGSP